MGKIYIKNRKNQKISVLIEIIANNKDLVFITHGLGGSKNQPIIEYFAKAFVVCDYNIVRFDATNTYGESEGRYEDATTTNYYEDLEDVIFWAMKQDWYKEPFVLVGHSLGGISIGLYAEKYPKKVRALAPISTVISGDLSIKNKPESIKEWKKNGWKISERKSKPGSYKKLPWTHMEDRLKYNLLDNVRNLTMPVLMIVGENDDSTPVQDQKILFNALPGKKEIHIINGAEHTFMEKSHLEKVKTIMTNWIKTL